MPTFFPEVNDPQSTDSMNRSLQKINGLLLAPDSGTYFSSANTVGGKFEALQILTEAKFSLLAGNLSGIANATVGSAIAIPAGTILYGEFTAILLHSGSGIAYSR
jgi:hypothetical protein